MTEALLRLGSTQWFVLIEVDKFRKWRSNSRMIKQIISIFTGKKAFVKIIGTVFIDGSLASDVKVYRFENDVIAEECLTDDNGAFQFILPKKSSGKIATRMSAYDFEPAWYYYNNIKKSVNVTFYGHISENPG